MPLLLIILPAATVASMLPLGKLGQVTIRS
jgi:hypothetical protein